MRLAIALFTLAVAVAAAGAFAVPADAAIEFEASVATVNDPGQIATDPAGRVYVPVRNSRQVLIFDSARNGNRLITSIGTGLVQDPAAVSVDNRGNIYVADAARNVVVLFGPYVSGAKYAGTDGAPGTGLGQFDGPVALATDIEPRLYVAEYNNVRVQVLDPARGALGTLFAFGVAEPGPFGRPNGIALDPLNRIYVVSAGVTGGLRLFDPRGAILTQVAAPGAAAGQITGALGVATDPVGRALVADSGNDRISFFNSLEGGLGLIETYGTSGAGAGQFNDPASLATAPGALLYVADAGNGRLLRLRYDDTDHDGAIDATDNCPGLANVDQNDHDGDRAGNPCDGDDDGDGLSDGIDPCPLTNPLVDSNKDGCSDPVTASVKPKRKSVFASGRGPARITGRAKADSVGIARVSVAIRRRSGTRCSWWSASKKSFIAGSCLRPRYVRARGTRQWYVPVRRKAFKAGKYTVQSRAVQRVTRAIEASRVVKTSFIVR
ncbi:MAG: NHL repeat-containing protein [Solirubrobacterales bacterium]